jgi:VIT1/CCC1 family predicted Fe2+/Mn2+ transporter
VRRRHTERHVAGRIAWLRAAVLGANDGVVSTASLMVGVAAAHAGSSEILVVGVAGLIAGAMSMAAGEYVSVSSQADAEAADLERERRELETDHEHEKIELAAIYEGRGLDPALALQVSEQLMAHDALAAHARDELGLTDINSARPITAAWTSAISFALGGALPLLALLFGPPGAPIPTIASTSLACLATTGALAARAGGANPVKGAARVLFWGAAAMLITAAVGALFDVGA